MNIAVIGLNHTTAPSAIRERAVMSDAIKIEILTHLLDLGLSEAVVLGTCGWNEIYIATPKDKLDQGIETIKHFWQKKVMLEDLTPYLYIKTGADAIEHMVQVAVGLDSIVLGEDQIIGQMKDAYAMAKELGATGRVLNVLFRDAISSAKKIKAQLKISEIPLSLSYVGVKQVNDHFALKEREVLLVGLGEMGILALENALALGARVTLTNRNLDKAKQVASAYPGTQVLDYEKKYDVIDQFDCLISATAAPHMLFKKDHFEHKKRPTVILDLSMPRDVDPSVDHLHHVTLVNIDVIQAQVDKNTQRRQDLVKEAHDMVKDHVADMAKWLENAQVNVALKDLNKLIDHIHTDAMAYLDHKLTTDKHQRVIIENTMKSALKRVVRQPILNLKAIEDEHERQQALKVIEKLFNQSWEA